MALDPQFLSLLPDRERKRFISAAGGISLGDGRVYKGGGNILSAGDAARTQADRERNAILESQTAGAQAAQRMLQQEQARVGVKPAIAPQDPNQILAQANILASQQRLFGNISPGVSPQTAPQIPNTTAAGAAPSGGIPSFIGSTITPENQNTAIVDAGIQRGMRDTASMGAPAPAVPKFLSGGYSAQDVAQMSPAQQMALSTFYQQQEQRNVAQEQSALAAQKTQAEIAKLNRKPLFETQDEAKAAGAKMAGAGQDVQVEPTPDGGFTYKVVQKPMPNVATPEDVAKSTLAQEEAKRVSGELGKLSTQVQSAADTMDQIKRTRQALASGAKTGALEAAKLQGALAINSILGSEVFKTSPGEIAKQSFSDMALSASARMRGQGQITENERKLLAQTIPQFGNSAKAVGAMLDFMTASVERTYALDNLRNELVSSGAAPNEIERQLNRFRIDNPINIDPKTGAVSYGDKPVSTQADTTSAPTPEQARAELERRRAAAKK